jgi:hypothetical protein
LQSRSFNTIFRNETLNRQQNQVVHNINLTGQQPRSARLMLAGQVIARIDNIAVNTTTKKAAFVTATSTYQFSENVKLTTYITDNGSPRWFSLCRSSADNNLKIGYSEQTCYDLRLLGHRNAIRRINNGLNR